MDGPFVRVRQGRILGGVATGIARKFDVPLWLIRLAFILLATVGGLGFALYGVAWLAVRDETETEPIATRLIRLIDGSTGWIGVALIGVAVLIVIDQIGFVRGDIAAAIVLGVLGVLLYRGELDFGSKDGETAPADTPAGQPSSPEGQPTKGTDMTVSSPAASTTPKPPAPPSPPRPPKPRPEPSILGRLTFGIGAIVLGAMGVIDSGAGSVDLGFRHYVSAAMLVAGVGLLVGAVWGRARGLIALGVILTPIVFFSPLGDLDFTGSVGERRVVPETVDAIPSEIDLGIGSLRVDMTEVDFSGAEVSTLVDIGIGEAIIIVPDDITVDVEGELGIGEIVVFGRTQTGVGVDIERRQEGSGGFLDLDLDGGVGSVRVIAAPAQATALADPTPFPGIDGTFADSTRITPIELDDAYALDDGDWFFDLGATDVSEGGAASDIDLGEGTLVISIPAGTSVAVDASVGTGIMSVLGSERIGVGLTDEVGNPNTADITIDVEVGSGILIITQENS